MSLSLGRGEHVLNAPQGGEEGHGEAVGAQPWRDGLPCVVQEAEQTLTKLGYVLALAFVPDSKPGSALFALAGARYNVLKVCL